MTNTDFTPVKTIWGTMHLHKSHTVWYKWNKYAQSYIVYHTSKDCPPVDPWKYDAICTGPFKTRTEAIQQCLERFNRMQSLKNRTFQYT